MNDTAHRHKWLFLLLLTALFLLLYPSQVTPQEIAQFSDFTGYEDARPLTIAENILDEVDTRKAQVFHNIKGLKDEILIEGHLRELNAVSKTREQSIEELIDHVSVWIPKLYRDTFWVNPECIIILEAKINQEEKAEVRFGVAMKCTVKYQVPGIINI